MKYNKGNIFIADLGKAKGSEQFGKRPVVVIQNDTGNTYSPTLIIAPITSRVDLKAKLPTHVFIPKYKNILEQDSLILAEQITTIDKERILEYVGSLDEDLQLKLDASLLISLGINVNKVNKVYNEFKRTKEYLELADKDYTNFDVVVTALVAYDNMQHSGNFNANLKEISNYMKMLVNKFSKEEIWTMLKSKLDNKLSKV